MRTRPWRQPGVIYEPAASPSLHPTALPLPSSCYGEDTGSPLSKPYLLEDDCCCWLSEKQGHLCPLPFTHRRPNGLLTPQQVTAAPRNHSSARMGPTGVGMARTSGLIKNYTVNTLQRWIPMSIRGDTVCKRRSEALWTHTPQGQLLGQWDSTGAGVK